MNSKNTVLLVIAAVIVVGAIFGGRAGQARRTERHLQELGAAPHETAKIVEAMSALRSQGKSICPELLNLLQSGDADVRTRAAVLIGATGCRDNTQALISALQTDSDALKVAAMQALGRLGTEDAVSQVAALLADDAQVEKVRLAAAYCLGMIGTESAIKPLEDILATRPAPMPPPADDDEEAPAPPPDETLKIRVAAASAMGHAQKKQAVNALAESVEPTIEPSAEVRHAAAHALADLGKATTDQQVLTTAISALVRALGDETGDVRAAAAYALGRVKVPENQKNRVANALREAGADDFFWTREAAQKAMRAQHVFSH